MANYWTGVQTDLVAAIKTAWSDVTDKAIERRNQAERVDWRTAVQNGTLPVPYVVLHTPPAHETTEWGGNNTVLEMDVSIYRIVRIAQPDTAAAMYLSLKGLQDELESHAHTTIQVLPGFQVDVSDNAATDSMQQAVMPFLAGALTFKCIFGETVTI